MISDKPWSPSPIPEEDSNDRAIDEAVYKDLGVQDKVKMTIKKEIGHVCDLFQQFINEIALNCITIAKSENKTSTDKMDAVDWLVRNQDFVSPK